MDTLRVCISGTGFAGDFTARAFGMIPHRNGLRIEIAGVTSGSLGNAERFAKRHGVTRAFATHQEMLDAVQPHVDCIACANHAHAQYVIEAAMAGTPVIVLEKPPLIWPGYAEDRKADPDAMKYESMEAFAEVLDAVEAHGAKLLYAENFTYVDGVKALVELLTAAQARGEGRVLLQEGVCAHQGSHAPAYDTPEKSGGGALFNKACHPLGPALYLKQIEGLLRDGKPIRPARVSGAALQVLKGLPKGAGKHFRVMRNVDDFGRMTVVFEDGTVADLHGHDLNIGGILNRFSAVLDFGRFDVRINPNNENEAFLPESGAAEGFVLREKLANAAGTSFPRPNQFHAHGYVNELDDAVACALETDRYPQSGTMLAWDTLATLMAAHESSAKGAAFVELDDIVAGRAFPQAYLPDCRRMGEVLPRP